EEVVLNVQGYMLKAKLPPIMRDNEYVPYNMIARTKLVHTEQYVRIGGLGSAQFDQSAVAMMNIHQLFESRLGKGCLQGWDVKREQGHIVLDFHNRYLTPRSSASSASIMDIPHDYDPRHILRSHMTDEVFTSDNVVQYYERVQDVNRQAKYHFKTSHPTSVSVGQMVEVQSSFVAVPRGKDKYKLICKLRSICVLDRSIENVSHVHCGIEGHIKTMTHRN
ncbi:uncharacterized protein B0H18DRAFT_880502, partial [Fomitopsis serialis]|uniref:uncharacterized protein n=1 Tax=Fomitopsis serialis TaxID=139415 RepID=UPI00200839F9